ncbi:uncharacterized protein LOC129596411 [Paramacrobiotus metropolitanus]|uniref:uncharacterized protein LOC129596411 n=1 Tax=Paramacrobiotus metropolitanus TaxID=2943436 RepID=UPI002446019D|nr:uncharacterized protein LOC129596411 [Paramacrobiotus metropolitanus]
MVVNLQFRLNAVHHGPVLTVFDESWRGGWNTVEVRDPNGIFRRAAVINVQKDGHFVVDFGYPGRRAEVVEHGKVFRTDHGPPPFYSEMMDVLIREFPTHPPAWYPAMDLVLQMNSASPNDAHTVVRVQFDNVLLTESISTKQLRIRPSENSIKRRIIAKNHFVKRCLEVPAKRRREFLLDSPDFRHLFRKILSMWQIFPVSLSAKKLVYIQQENSEPLLVASWDNICKELLNLSPNLRHLGNYTDRNLSMTTEISDAQLSVLLPELLSSTFRMLDFVDRLQQRRVCQLWNAIFLADDAQEVRITFDPLSGDSCNSDLQYTFTVCMLKCVTTSNQCLIIQKARPGVQTFQYCCKDSLCLLWLEQALCQQPIGKKRTIAFCSFLWLADGIVYECPVKYLADKCQQLASVCSTVMWRHCRICCDDAMYDDHICLYHSSTNEDREVYGSRYGDLPLFSGIVNPLSNDLFCDLLDIIDCNLPVVGPDLTVLSEWIDAAPPSDSGWNAIAYAVRNYWFRDPRSKESEQNWLDFRHRRCGWDIAKLPRPVLYALARVMILYNRRRMKGKSRLYVPAALSINANAIAARLKKIVKMN